MAIWLIRGGKYGEHEERFLKDNRIYLTWGGLQNLDLSIASDFDQVRGLVQSNYPGESVNKIGNWTGQIWAFTLAMKEKEYTKWITDKIEWKQLVGIISNSDLVLSMRYHPTLISLTSGVPLVDITHHGKNKNFLKTFGVALCRRTSALIYLSFFVQ
jgi:hypothetical protein